MSTPNPQNTLSSDANIVAQLRIQQENISIFNNFEANYNKTPKTRFNKIYLDAKLQTLEVNWKKIENINEVLAANTSSEKRLTTEYFATNVFLNYYEKYLELKDKIATKMFELEPQPMLPNEIQSASGIDNPIQIIQQPSTANDIRLVPIDIPIFSGNYYKWREFYAMYNSLVHNKPMSNIHKLHYLKTHLSGEASQLIRNIEITEENYEVAYDLLKKRYENKRLLINAQLKNLLSQQNLVTESAIGIKRILDTTSECMKSIANLGINIESWDPIVIYIIIQKLDTETHRIWEQTLQNPREPPTLQQLSDFLENRFHSLEMCQNNNSKFKPTQKEVKYMQPIENKYVKNVRYNNSHSTTAAAGCKYCQENHSIFRCLKFKQMDEQQRSCWARQSARCLNCLQQGHKTLECPSNSKCLTCHKKHHTLLHFSTKSNQSHQVASNTSYHCNIEQSDLTPQSSKHIQSSGLHSTNYNYPSNQPSADLQINPCYNLNKSNSYVQSSQDTQANQPNQMFLGESSRSVQSYISPQFQQSHGFQQSTQPLRSNTTTTNTEVDNTCLTRSCISDYNAFKNQLSYNSNLNLPIENHVLLATVLVRVNDANGDTHIARALLDQGSQATFITEAMVQKLRLARKRVNATICGIGETDAGTTQGLTQLSITSIHDSHFTSSIDAYVMNKLTDLLPNQKIPQGHWHHLKGLLLADPTYNQPGNIDLLLGADVYAQILLEGVIKGPNGSPIAQQTTFGWVLSGKINQNSKFKITNLHTTIDQQLQKFWEIEELQGTKLLTTEELQCEQFYARTVRRKEDGRYIVRLPLKSEITTLGNSQDRAIARLLQLERKFDKHPKFREEYTQFINEYIELGHMKVVNSNKSSNKIYYIPHHAVLKEASTTTKLRVVFDASAKTDSNTSLNDQLMVGPTIQNEIVNILLRWRKYKIGFTADIAKMYRQIESAEEDWDLQRIIWRDTPNSPFQQFQLRTVTYGTACAPYLAIRTLHQLANDDKAKYPKAYNTVINDFYVDDVMTGSDTEEKAIELQNQLMNLLKGGGFELRKWTSNSNAVLKNVKESFREVDLPLEINHNEDVKALGIHWNPQFDNFQFKVRLNHKNQIPTKRNILSETARLFDPLGWLAPVIIVAKIIFQQLWLEKLDWDQKVPQNISTNWLQFRNELQQIQNIKIPRWIKTENKQTTVEIHGFCDASTKAYAAVVYARVLHTNGKISTTLLTAKTRVAPLKIISLPRLELCGAVLLTHLLKKVKSAMEFTNAELHAWTDSEIVLAWLRAHPSKWKTFVANRVSEIHQTLNATNWYYIASEMNPADPASRGVMPKQLQTLNLWWHGPKILQEDWNSYVNNWQSKVNNIELEKRKPKTFILTNIFPFDLINKFSKLYKLIRVTAYCKRFCNNSTKSTKIFGSLSVEELSNATDLWIRIIQNEIYSKEIKTLQETQSVHKKSSIVSLNPWLDSNGILRVGGRLKHANISFNAKHPIILPAKHQFTSLIIQQAHEITLHGGAQITTNYIRQRYWIATGRDVIRQKIHQCVICYRFKTQSISQLMGDLPKARITLSRPFTNTGVDYAGPINVRCSKGRNVQCEKGYIAVFVCFATKAIHIEVVSSQTSEAFLAAFNRFTARRGRCANLYSDNGTNFVGANNVMTKEVRSYAKLFNKTISEVLANEGTQWHFIPPSSPHFGGLWESGVRSLKNHFKRVIGDTRLTYEELSTVMSQIEACLNSRPLCPLTEDPEDLNALTPGHFLVGEALIAPPQSDLTQLNINHIKQFRLLTALQQHFWKRWHIEYLSRLQQRPKWTIKNKDIEVGDLMILKEDNLPPTKWKLCRIVEKHSGLDNITRVVTIKTDDGFLKRPIVKLSPLPIIDNCH